MNKPSAAEEINNLELPPCVYMCVSEFGSGSRSHVGMNSSDVIIIGPILTSTSAIGHEVTKRMSVSSFYSNVIRGSFFTVFSDPWLRVTL